jgi:hypothetical protein
MAGNNDKNFCGMSYNSFKKNLSPEIYTGEYAKNLHWHELDGVGHDGVTAVVGAEMLTIDTDISAFYNMHDSAYDCDSRKIPSQI